MVLRLFVQPAEGKHWLVPMRPEPLPANATISYSVITSTVLAAGYASYATKFSQRVGPASGISVPGLFVRASARAGVWCALTGAAVNWYYHYGFAAPVAAASNVKDEKWKIWEKTDKYTVDDGLLAGAGLGLGIGLVSAVLMRRSPVAWWTRCIGMANIGAFAGITASNGYFQYTGERQKAVLALEQWRRRRNLEFHWIYWNKLVLTNLSPLAQAYVLCNGIFHTSRIPQEVLHAPEKYGFGLITDPFAKENSPEALATSNTPNAPRAADKTRFYRPVDDYAEYIKTMDVPDMQQHIKDLDKKRQDLLREADYMAHQISQRQHELCHVKHADEDERLRLRRELQLIKIVFNRFRQRADEMDRRMYFGNQNLQHKRAWEAKDETMSSWEPQASTCDSETLVPSLAIKEFSKIREAIAKQVAQFEEQSSESSHAPAEERGGARRNLDDGRVILRAADRVHYELEKRAKKKDDKVAKIDTKETPPKDLEPSKP